MTSNRIDLYSGAEYFLLRIGNRIVEINEPANWSKNVGVLLRDAVFYGFNYEFISGSSQLQFLFNDGGAEELVAAYKADAGDASVQLEFGIQDSSLRTAQFIGDLNFNDYNLIPGEGVTLTVDKTSFESLLRTRYETKVSLNEIKDYEGNFIDPPPTIDLLLHSKNIVRTSEILSLANGYIFIDGRDNLDPYDAVLTHWVIPDTDSTVSDELQVVQKSPFNVIDHSPITDGLFQYEAAEAGFLQLTYSWSGDIRYGNEYIAGDQGGVFTYYYYIERAGFIPETRFRPGTVNDTLNINLSIEKGDKVYFGIMCQHVVPLAGVFSDSYRNHIILRQQTVAPPSLCKAYRTFDFLEFLLRVTTGKKNRLISEYYGEGGAGEKSAITSGYAIRNFDVNADKPVQCSIKTALDSLQALQNIGVGFKSVDGLDYMLVEPMLHFYRRGIIAVIDDAYDWVEDHDKDRTYNEFDIGFAKYSTNGDNALDDANTEQSWLLPIKKYKAKLSKKSDFITSGYLIEEQRREQFKDAPNKSVENDDSIFIIAYADRTRYEQIGYQCFDNDDTIIFSKPVGLVVGDKIQLEGSVLNTGMYEVYEKRFGEQEVYRMIGSLAAETGYGTLVIFPALAGADTKVAERNEPFKTLENVIDPGSIYNARFMPKYCMFSWAPFLNIGMSKKADNDVMTNTFSKNNGKVVSDFLPGAYSKGFAGTQVIRQDADFALSNFARIYTPFTCEIISFKAVVPYKTIEVIKQALRGETNTDGDFTCILVRDENGVAWPVCVQEIKYDFSTGIGEFTVNKIDPLTLEHDQS